MTSTLTKPQSNSPSYVQRGKKSLKAGQTPPLSPQSPESTKANFRTNWSLGPPARTHENMLLHVSCQTEPESNHEETSDEPRLGDILPKNWPVSSHGNVTKLRGSGPAPDKRRPKRWDNSMHLVIQDWILDE